MTDIFEQIDHALEDWAVGPDAMRWAPDAKVSRPNTGGVVNVGCDDVNWALARYWMYPALLCHLPSSSLLIVSVA